MSAMECQFRQTGCRMVSGLRQCLWLESLDDPGYVIWLSTWDSLEDCRAFLTGAAYMRWVETTQAFLQAEPQGFRFRVLQDLLQASPGRVKEVGVCQNES